MKVLFLDHDGVMTTTSEYGSRFKKIKDAKEILKVAKYTDEQLEDIKDEDFPSNIRFDDFSKDAVLALNDIIINNNIEIVITSDWRKSATLDELQSMYAEYGVYIPPFDVTEEFNEIKPKGNSKRRIFPSYEFIRSIEIEKYLKDHPEITHWCVVDDMDLNSVDVNNFVQTDEVYGISDPDVVDLINYYLSDDEDENYDEFEGAFKELGDIPY